MSLILKVCKEIEEKHLPKIPITKRGSIFAVTKISSEIDYVNDKIGANNMNNITLNITKYEIIIFLKISRLSIICCCGKTVKK